MKKEKWENWPVISHDYSQRDISEAIGVPIALAEKLGDRSLKTEKRRIIVYVLILVFILSVIWFFNELWTFNVSLLPAKTFAYLRMH